MGLLKVNAAKENNDVYVSIFFFFLWRKEIEYTLSHEPLCKNDLMKYLFFGLRSWDFFGIVKILDLTANL